MVFRIRTLRYLLRAQSLDNMLCYLPVTERFFFSVAETRSTFFFTNNAVNHMHSVGSLCPAHDVTAVSRLLLVV